MVRVSHFIERLSSGLSASLLDSMNETEVARPRREGDFRFCFIKCSFSFSSPRWLGKIFTEKALIDRIALLSG